MDEFTATDLFVRSMLYLANNSSQDSLQSPASPFWNLTNPNPFNMSGKATMDEWCGGTENRTFNTWLLDEPIKSIKVADCFNLTDAANHSQVIAASVDRLHKVFRAANISLSKGYSHVEYDRIQLAENITFDSITIEFARVIANGSNDTKIVDAESSNTEFSVGSSVCSKNGCRGSEGIMVEPSYITDLDWKGEKTTIIPFTRLARTCSDHNESLVVADFDGDFGYPLCEKYSNTSMLVYSLGKRVEGDVWDYNSSTSEMNITNFRFVYSFTVGRLSWKTSDLAQQFGASCLTTKKNCEGLSIPLDNGTEMLLVSSSKLPIQYMNAQPRDMWSISDPTYGYPKILLPRHFKKVTGAMRVAMKTDEGDLYLKWLAPYFFAVERNHMYMEQSLQVAYTLSLFYLFQNGVAVSIHGKKDSRATDAIKLSFSNNTVYVNLVATIWWQQSCCRERRPNRALHRVSDPPSA